MISNTFNLLRTKGRGQVLMFDNTSEIFAVKDEDRNRKAPNSLAFTSS